MIGLISEHSKYFETFLQKKQKIEACIGFYLYFCIVHTHALGQMGEDDYTLKQEL